MEYKTLDLADLDRFVDLRMEFLLSYQDLPQAAAFREMTKQYLQEHMKKEDLMILAAEAEGQLIAACMVCFYETCPMADNPSGKYGELRNVYTRPAYRRKGISEKLVRMALEKAKDRGVKKMRLHYTDDGLPLYQKLGFVPEARYMEKDLEGTSFLFL